MAELEYMIDTLVKLPCRFNLKRYPFSIQQCAISIWFSGNNATDPQLRFLYDSDLEEKEIKFEGTSRHLGEFYLSNATIQLSKSYQQSVIMQFTLVNLYGFHLLNSFTPSILIFIICYTTLFFPLKDFNERVMVPLTALLVLATLFSQASNASVRTSYFKLLDIWYVILTTFCFMILMFNIIMNKCLMKSRKRIRRLSQDDKNKDYNLLKTQPCIQNAYQYNLIFKYAIAIAFLLFCIIYTLAAANII